MWSEAPVKWTQNTVLSIDCHQRKCHDVEHDAGEDKRDYKKHNTSCICNLNMWKITIKNDQPKIEIIEERKPITDKLANRKCGALRRSRRFRRRKQARPLPKVPAKNPMFKSEMSAKTTAR